MTTREPAAAAAGIDASQKEAGRCEAPPTSSEPAREPSRAGRETQPSSRGAQRRRPRPLRTAPGPATGSAAGQASPVLLALGYGDGVHAGKARPAEGVPRSCNPPNPAPPPPPPPPPPQHTHTSHTSDTGPKPTGRLRPAEWPAEAGHRRIASAIGAGSAIGPGPPATRCVKGGGGLPEERVAASTRPSGAR